MLNLIGALLIVGGCGYLGMRVAFAFRQRTDILRFLQNGLNLLETEINYGATPLPQALQRVGDKLDNKGGIIFSHAADVLTSKGDVLACEAWEEGIKRLSEHAFLRSEEINILTMFGRALGMSDKKEQLKNIALAREQLRMVEKSARNEREKNQRMWQCMGFCVGIVIALILI